ncbi:alpha/beta fold hydrolase [Halococcus saccharolyticus]|uniref:Alpha/beta hydrolase fold protein n=1 Tax=Halococcus saccharolyticus DSM 5350 TaxID=1227455 RepID=M0MN61_9EURY|nr:alpha/beta hydrolase [Halococcus saccharolyticus]EMA46179.1 alpha/beta hydrolase fold protein [Halococcus saccharolyticus DSM 5350]
MVDVAGTIAGLFGTNGPESDGSAMLDVARDIRANPRTIDCRDGRQLGYADCGDPDGDPLVVFHGFPNSRVFGALFDAPARERGLRILAPERPGLGVSDPLPDRTVADWTEDVADLADALDLGSFPVLGVSGGGPYAAACAACLPRTERAGIVCGLAPLESVEFGDRLPFLIAEHARPLATLSLWSDGLSVRRNPEEYLASRAETAADVDEEHWKGEIGWTLLESGREATAHHGYGPLANELAVFADDWGFDLDAVDVPTYLWYGKADRIVPVSMGLHYADRIPTAEAHVYPDYGHLSTVEENEAAILDALAGV